MKIFSSSFGEYTLDRYPKTQDVNLQAWDAGDHYLLNHLADIDSLGRVLIINDTFGALTTALYQHDITVWSDSKLAELSYQKNYRLNGLPENYSFVPSTETPKGLFDTVIIKIPGTNRYLDDILLQLTALVKPDSRVIGAGMAKYWTKKWPQYFADRLGHSECSLTWKKARLILSNTDALPVKQAAVKTSSYRAEPLEMTIGKLSNVYGQDYLDVGARVLIAALPDFNGRQTLADLGCGSGELGLCALSKNSTINVEFIDESYQAVASAKANVMTNLPGAIDRASFTCSDGLIDKDKNSYDVVLCNPPFHQQQTIGDHIAWNMMHQARNSLKPGGELWLVGNRHLNYNNKLQRLFGNCDQVGGSDKFVVFKSVKT
ncbi:methyltransferase [Sinobacterium norvegicum]|nr:methyltransferase [Sinobacterium norvegicum]